MLILCDGFGHPVAFSAPVLELVSAGAQGELHLLWAANYINRFNFGVRHTSDLTTAFADLPVSNPVGVSGDKFKMPFPIPATTAHFYYLVISLR